jgi:pimeloyl-ACP methyl ester carboxylesterase
MPVNPYSMMSLFAAMACAPRYSALPTIMPADLHTPLPVQHMDVSVDGALVEVAFVDSDIAGTGPGADEPPIVFIHGLSSYMGFWEHQLPHFAKHRRVLALDLPGYGASGRPDAPYTPPWYAEVVHQWLAALSIDSAVIVGHSMGGQVAITLAVTHPDQVDHLVLAAPAGLERFSPGTAAWMKDYWHEGRALEATEMELRATFTTVVFNRPDAGVERLLEERVRMSNTPAFRGTSVAVSRSIAGMLDHPVTQELSDITMPSLLIFGTDDRMIPNPVFTGGATRTIAEQGAAAIPGARLVLIPGAGHTVHHDAPDAFNRHLAEFLGL